MALDFPTPTTVGQIYTQGSLTYIWDGTKWVGQSPAAVIPSKIQKGNTSAEVVDTGSDGQFKVTTEGTERLRIDSSGRLLLGTTTEGYPFADTLTIAESGNSGITIRSGTTSSGAVYFSDATSGTGEYDGWVDYSHNNRTMHFGVAATERMRISSSGNVFIGGTSAGTADIALNANGSATFAGTVTANAFSGDGSALTNLPAAGVSLGLAIALG